MKKLIFILAFFLFSCTTNTPVLQNAGKEASGEDTALYDLGYARTSIPLDVRLRGIWLVGGKDNGHNLISGVDLFDPQTGTWYEDATALPTPRMLSGVTIADQKIYVIGGIDSSGYPCRLVEVFDLVSFTWSQGASYPFNIQGLRSVTINGRIFCAGGSTRKTADGATTKIIKYNPLYNTWNQIYDILGTNAIANARLDLAGAVLDGVLFLTGGRNYLGTALNLNTSHYVSDYYGVLAATVIPATRSALSVASYSSAKNKYLLLTGGITVTANLSQPVFQAALNTFYYYKPVVNTASMTAGTVMGQARSYHSSVVWGASLYVFGGTHSGSAINSYEYIADLETPANLTVVSWQPGTMPKARYAFQAVSAYGQ
ncbi:MAG TPA: hypothetical protein DHW82_03600 [Spirochaetia bacterium]|nr:MAG: hypothetical protein A2Y41_07360 [Spirochaetes bacterium GWB1_36_13]HCL56078.1 hypothetical protein [Spirochaetia bacterium]